MRKAVVTALLTVLVVSSFGAGYLAGSGISRTETLTSTSTLMELSTVTVGKTVTSTTTSTVLIGQPIPVASVEIANITVAGGNAVAVNSNSSRVYVLGSSSLTVVDASSHSVLASVSLPGKNQGGIVNAGLAIDSSTGMVYASLEGEVVMVNGSTNSVAGTLPFSLGTLAFDSATGMLWGTQPFESRVVEVDPGTGSVVANVSVGFAPYGIAVDSHNDMVYSAGCSGDFVCGSEAALVNGTSGTLVTTVSLSSLYYSTMTLNPETDVLYVSGERMLAALNGTNGQEIFQAGYADTQTCSPFLDMAINPSSNQVLMVPQDYDYLLVYDGASGALVNMYSFPEPIHSVAFDPATNEIYVTESGELLALHNSVSTGNVNSTAIGSHQNCLPP